MHPICYLCGEPISDEVSRDHVPPQQFYAPSLRQRFNLDKLTTLPTHDACNKAYGRDEEYVICSLVAPSQGSVAANALFQHHVQKFRAGQMQGLVHKIMSSFDERPSGLHLPNNRVVMRLEGERVKRVVWKIVRGLYYIETGAVLPENTTYTVEMREPENRDPSELDDLWNAVKAQPDKGDYKGVFAYKHADLAAGDARIHGWGMLWWDRLMWFVGHHHPGAPGDDAG